MTHEPTHQDDGCRMPSPDFTTSQMYKPKMHRVVLNLSQMPLAFIYEPPGSNGWAGNYTRGNLLVKTAPYFAYQSLSHTRSAVSFSHGEAGFKFMLRKSNSLSSFIPYMRSSVYAQPRLPSLSSCIRLSCHSIIMLYHGYSWSNTVVMIRPGIFLIPERVAKPFDNVTRCWSMAHVTTKTVKSLEHGV